MTNLSRQLNDRLPVPLGDFVRAAGEAARARGEKLYVVGGVVRDLLLGLTNLDLDLVVEGDAVGLAQQMASQYQTQVTVHRAFSTAKVKWDRWSVDFATARSETYPKPGALPVVKPSTLAYDLIRRDFTINAMAVDLTPAGYGDLVDLHGGQADLRARLVKILHERSFVDDATRILRAVRYEQRLDFRLEDITLALLRRDIPRLDTISPDRLRHELELFLKEPAPEKVLLRAEELGVLVKLHPGLFADERLAANFSKSRREDAPSASLCLALLAYRMTPGAAEDFATRLKFPKTAARVIVDSAAVRAREDALSDYRMSRSAVYRQVAGLSPVAVTAGALSTTRLIARRHLELYLSELRHVKTELTGTDLPALGVAPGPEMHKVLARLLDARLDGKVKSREDEEKMARNIISESTP